MKRNISFRNSMGKLLVGLVLVGTVLGMGLGASAAEPIVQAIAIRGNENIDTALIQSAITQTRVGEPAVEDSILNDLHSIYDLGYFYDVTANLESAPDGVKVIFTVDENPIVRDIVFRGAEKAPVENFVQRMRVQPGDVLNVNHVMEDLRELPDWILMEYGIALRPTDLKAGDDGVITMDITETVITDIRIEGNKKTRDFVIERELTIEPGDILDMNEVNRSLRRVLMLGFFDEINRSFVDGETPDETIMTIEVVERRTGTATFGAGYSTNDGLIGFVDVAEENFLGRGQRINAYLEIGQGQRRYELGFFEPYLDASGTSLGANVYKRDRDVSVFESETRYEGTRHVFGGDLTLGRPLGEYTRGRVTFKAQNISYSDLTDAEDNPLENAGNRYTDGYATRIIGTGVRTNTTDHPFFPTGGWKNDAYFELGTSLLGGDAVYTKLDLEHSRYFEVRDGGFVLGLRGMGGRRLTGTLEENELYRIGGLDTLRGYTRGAREELIGDKMLVVNAEFRFPIVNRVQGVVFTDWGRAWDVEESMDLTELKNSYGLGVRLDTPIGLMRLDYGWGLDEEEQRSGQFYFGIGQMF